MRVCVRRDLAPSASFSAGFAGFEGAAPAACGLDCCAVYSVI